MGDKIRIFKNSEKKQVYRNPCKKPIPGLPGFYILLNEKAKQVIDGNGTDQDNGVTNTSPGKEHEAGEQKPIVSKHFRNKIITY